ncbi:MAG: helix-turn-helix domain-containing protein [Spirosomataceae bacterium]
MAKNKSSISECPITRTMDLIGGKWSLPIIYGLMKGTKRFKELERSIEGINTRMLVKELKQLEESGIISGKVFAEVPPRVEYSLTPKGQALKNVLLEMQTWGKKFVEV